MLTDTTAALGGAIRARRKARGLTLAELGRRAEMDVSQLSKVERGSCATSPDAYRRIAEALGWSPSAMWKAATPRRPAA